MKNLMVKEIYEFKRKIPLYLTLPLIDSRSISIQPENYLANERISLYALYIIIDCTLNVLKILSIYKTVVNLQQIK